jgi:hypothetical protein
LSSTADGATDVSLNQRYLKFRTSITSWANLSAITISSNVKLCNLEVVKLYDGSEQWLRKISVIFEAMGLYELFVSGIDPSPLASAEDLLTF